MRNEDRAELMAHLGSKEKVTDYLSERLAHTRTVRR